MALHILGKDEKQVQFLLGAPLNMRKETLMKKVLIGTILVLMATTSFAQYHHGWNRPVYVYRDNWIAPLIIGGIAGAVIAKESQPVIVQQPPVLVQQPQSVIIQRQPVCTEWKEIQMPDGQIYRERSCTQ